jgi:transposase
MSGTVTSMSMIKQVLQLHKSGNSNRSIAMELGLDKETVNTYVRTVKANNYDIEELLKLEDPVLEGKFKAGAAAYTDKRFDALKERLPHIEQEMKNKHVTRNLLWHEYLAAYPDGYRYTQFCFHLNQLQIARKPVAHLTHNPGEKLYIDFAGDTAEFVDGDTGEVHKVQVFVATLPYSDYTFAMAVASQSTADFLYALSRCLSFLGGSPKIVVPDNLKAAVIRADKYEPELNRLMADFANHYGFVVSAARPGHPRDKSSVENAVKIIYNRVYAPLRNRTFFGIEELNVAFAEKVRDHNQTRMQQRDHSREELFIAEEKPALTPLPQREYEVKYYIDLRVAPNNYICLKRDNHYYSVPYAYIGQKVSVIYTRTLVQVYFLNQSVAVHQRVIGYGYTTVKEHLCSSHQHYLGRSPEYYIEKAKRCSEELEKLIRRIFEQTQLPETMYKRCDGLLNLYRKTELKAFESACRMAIDHGQLTCKFVQRVIEKKTYKLYETPEGMTVGKSLPKHDNVRGSDYYSYDLFD